MLSKEDIKEIYKKHVKINNTKAYVNKYIPLPVELNDKAWKWEGKDFPRIISLLEFREYMLEYNKMFDVVLSFNGIDIWGGRDPEYGYLKYKSWYDLSYDESVKYDLHRFKLKKNDFDFAMLNQTIEHLYDPVLALKNIYNHMKIGGIFYANVPSNSIPHNMPFHFYTGITPVGLGVMIKLAGFDILKIGQWGNKEYLRQSNISQWPDYTYSDNPGYNEMDCPIITWCFAIKNK